MLQVPLQVEGQQIKAMFREFFSQLRVQRPVAMLSLAGCGLKQTCAFTGTFHSSDLYALALPCCIPCIPVDICDAESSLCGMRRLCGVFTVCSQLGANAARRQQQPRAHIQRYFLKDFTGSYETVQHCRLQRLCQVCMPIDCM